MGFYIQTPGAKGKAEHIANHHGGQITLIPPKWDSIPSGRVPVVVVDNGPLEAAGIGFSEQEYKEFTDPGDPRPKVVVLLCREKVIELCPEVEGKLQ